MTRTKVYLLLPAILIIALISCSAFNKHKKQKNMYSYLALGDSYTIGEQVPGNENFPHQAVALLKKKNIEVADPVIIATTGWTTDELAASIREHNIRDKFSFVTLLIGVNNQYRDRDVDNYREELEPLINKAVAFAQGKPEHVFILSIPDWGVTPFAEGRDHAKIHESIDAYNAAKMEVALRHKCHFIEITESTRQNGTNAEYLATDGLHPSGKEYAVWAEKLADEVEREFKK
ncbi:MAG: SGNH/GDSL hydrolase family protein [Taibaiella sp.]|nr:SGNH/GDSL hydrolase family protein [Taibaiella sp.]